MEGQMGKPVEDALRGSMTMLTGLINDPDNHFIGILKLTLMTRRIFNCLQVIR
jgi:hypothetical protein